MNKYFSLNFSYLAFFSLYFSIYPCELKIADDCGKSLLYQAVEANNIPLVTQLLQSKADTEKRDLVIGHTPLAVAIINDNSMLVKLLLDANACPATKIIDKDTGNWLFAFEYADAKQMKKIYNQICKSIDLWRLRASMFITCIEENKLIDANTLLNKGIYPNYQDDNSWTPLIAASSYNRVEFVKILLEKNANVNAISKCGKSALHFACLNGSVEIAKLLLDNCANNSDADNLSMTPLMFAAITKEAAIVKLLIEDKADLKAKDSFGYTALNIATDSNSAEIIKLLQAAIKAQSGCCCVQ